MNNIVSTTTEYRDRTRVEIENLLPWQVGFKPYTLPEKKGVILDGGYFKDGEYKKSIFRQMTLEELITQISCENVAFIGTDGKGSHAAFRICDFEIYKVAFDLPDATDLPVQLTQDAISKLLKISDLKKFKKGLEELVVTQSEKRAFAYYVINAPILNEIPLSILREIEMYTGFDVVY